MKRNSKVFGMLAAGILSAALLADPALAADPEIRVGSYKGNTLEAGERSCLIIGPAGPEYTAESSKKTPAQFFFWRPLTATTVRT